MAIHVIIIITIVIVLLFRFYLRSNVAMCESKEMMNEKVVIVTGGNGGIGFEAAKGLAKRGARVILACRSEQRGVLAADKIRDVTGNKDVIFKPLDLASLQSVRSFCQDIIKNEKRLDVLVNNAGGFDLGNRHTADGIVEDMQVNYFGSFLLTLLLLPLLKKSRPSRIVMLSSILAYLGVFNPIKINEQKYFSNLRTYSNSKLCQIIFTIELTRRLKNNGVVVNSVHPGIIVTDIVNNSNILNIIGFKLFCWLTQRSVGEGAQTPLYLAVDKAVETVSGKLFCDCKQWPIPLGANHEEVGIALWHLSTKLVGYSEDEEEKLFSLLAN